MSVNNHSRCIEYDGELGYPDLRCDECKKREQPPIQPAGDVVDDTISAMIATYREDESGKFKPVRDRMTDAYQVARAQVIAERDAQWEKATREMFTEFPDLFQCADVDETVKCLRARLAQADKPRTPAERVTVKNTERYWIVYRDGEEVVHFHQNIYGEKDAERYAAGLRAELEKAQ